MFLIMIFLLNYLDNKNEDTSNHTKLLVHTFFI